jgi:hypothetical protein
VAKLTACAVVGLLVSTPASAQEMEPKAYSASPVGTTFLVAFQGHVSYTFKPRLWLAVDGT